MVPRPVRRWAGSLAAEEMTPHRETTAAAIERIRPRAKEQVEALTWLLGRAFPEWTTVNARG
jgi:hypothetical protein